MLEKRCIVVGGGPAGLAAAAALVDRGFHVEIIDRNNYLGGKTAGFCCKADDACTRCGACHADHYVERLWKHPAVTLYLAAKATSVKDDGVTYHVGIEAMSRDETFERTAPFLILSTGYTVFDAAQKEPFGYGRYADVVTALEVEKFLMDDDVIHRRRDGKPAESVAFIQCVGSRDIKLGAEYCSQVCCAFAIRLANMMKHRMPSLKVSFFYMDIQSPSRSFDGLLLKNMDRFRVIRGLPGEVLLNRDGRLRLAFERDTSDLIEEDVFDMVILSVGIRPAPPAESVLETLDLKLDEHGFLIPPERHGRLAVAGTAAGPMSIMASMAHAVSAVETMLRFAGEIPS